MMNFCGNNSYINMPQCYVRSFLLILFLSWAISKKTDKSSKFELPIEKNLYFIGVQEN